MYLGIDKHDSNCVAAIDSNGVSVTYGELCQYVKKLKSFLTERSVVFLLCENSVGALCAYLACIESKAIPLILSSKIDKQILEELIIKYKPRYLWVEEERSYNVTFKVINVFLGYKLLQTSNSIYDVHKDLALLLSTSGSTGSPKLVRHNYNNLIKSAQNVAKFFEITKSDRALADLPIFYTMGHSVICSHLYAGATVLLTSLSMLSKEFWKFFVKYKVTTFTGVPYSYEILKRLDFTSKTWPCLKVLTQGGGKLNDKLYIEFAEYAQRNNIKFIPTFGQTECTARMAYLPYQYALTKIGSIGNAIPEGKLSLIGDDGNKIEKCNVQGELVYEGPNVTMGYAENIEDLIKGDEWKGKTFTGDIARFDADNCYYIVGRKKRFLKLYGLRVSLDQCEKIIKNEYGIECVCAGNDKKMLIFIENDIDKNSIKRLLSIKTGIVVTAFEVVLLPILPRNEYGKIKYKELEQRS